MWVVPCWSYRPQALLLLTLTLSGSAPVRAEPEQYAAQPDGAFHGTSVCMIRVSVQDPA